MCELTSDVGKTIEVRDFRFIDTKFFDLKIGIVTYYSDNITFARMKIGKYPGCGEYGVEIANKTTKDAIKELILKANFFHEGKDLDQYVDKLIPQMKLIFPNETTTRKLRRYGCIRHDVININNKSYSYVQFDVDGWGTITSFVWGDDGKIMEGKDKGHDRSVAQALVNGNIIDESKKEDILDDISILGKWRMYGFYD